MVLRYWLDASLATPVQVLVGGRFIRTAVAFLRRCSSNMSTLVALSSTMAYIYSCYALIAATARAMSGGDGASNTPMFDMPAMRNQNICSATQIRPVHV